jgi:beta-lactamase regulating signal transducer with metallopeptidase domain
MTLSAADVVAALYGAALIATLPLLIAVVASRGIRGLGAPAQVQVWRATVVVLLATACGRLLPGHWLAWVLPGSLSVPFVALGRAPLQLEAGYTRSDMWSAWLLAVYLAGVVLTLLQLVGSRWRLARVARRAPAEVPPAWLADLQRARVTCGVERDVQLLVSDAVSSPMTWGARHPVLLLPARAHTWSREQRYLALLHEMLHVRAGDAAWGVAARVMRAVFWFHPGAWWLEARLLESEEHCCDDRVLLSGAKRSTYAELLVDAGCVPHEAAACSLGSGGVRARLQRIVDDRHMPRHVSRQATRAIVVLGASMSVVAATAHVAPTRAVLHDLVSDGRWETRAYAVRRLAQRRDSVAVARRVASTDPHPGVRAVAEIALTRTPFATVGDTLVFVRN